MEQLLLRNSVNLQVFLATLGYRISDSIEQVKEENSIWFLVALFVLAAFAIALVPAMFMYCVSRGMQFSGGWSWARGAWTPSVWLECKH